MIFKAKIKFRRPADVPACAVPGETLGWFTEMSTATTASMRLNECRAIDPDRLSSRKQPTLPLLCEHHREEALKEGTG